MASGLNRFTLTFIDPALEGAYRTPRSDGWRQLAITAAATAAVWASSVPVYAATVPALLGPGLWMAFGFMVPSLGLVLLLTRVVPAAIRPQAIAHGGSVVTLVSAAALIAMQAQGGEATIFFSSAGMAIILLGSHVFVQAPFLQRVLLTWVLFAVYEVVITTVVPLSPAHVAGTTFSVVCAQMFGTYIGYLSESQKRRIFVQRRTIEEERVRSERLLQNMLPGPIAEKLKREAAPIAEGFDAVTVLFADIVGFTPLSARLSPRDLVALLNEVFSRFDEMARRLRLEKIKTIGDAYMVVGGLPVARSDHAGAVATMALEMRAALRTMGHGLELRIGLHTGPVVAGVIGTSKYSYDLWGDTVNTASRMESHGLPGEIHLTDACRAALGDSFDLRERGTIEIKGKGAMRTWFLDRAAVPGAAA